MYKNHYSQKNIDNRIEEELESIWNPIEGSKVSFQSTKQTLKLYTENVFLIERGIITKNIYKYNPMFRMYIYKSDGERVDIYMTTNNCVTLAALLDILTSTGTIRTYFCKSEVSGWHVVSNYNSDTIFQKELNKKTILEVIPYVDERRLPAYLFIFKREDGMRVQTVFTAGEVRMLKELMYGFVQNAPLHISTFKNESYRQNIEKQITEIDNLKYSFNTLAKEIYDLKNVLNSQSINQKSNMEAFMEMFQRTLQTMMHNVQPVVSNNIVPEFPKPVEPEMVKREIDESENDDKNDLIMLCQSDIEFDLSVDMDENTISEEAFTPTEEEKKVKEDNYFDTTSAKTSINVPTCTNNSNDSTELLENVVDVSSILNNKSTKKLSDYDPFLQSVEDRMGKDVVPMDEKSGVSVADIYMPQYVDFINEDFYNTEVIPSILPADYKKHVENMNLNDILAQFEGMHNASQIDMKYSLIRYMVESKMFGNNNIFSMFIDRSLVGTPFSSSVYSIACLAAGYELVKREGVSFSNAAMFAGETIIRRGLNTPFMEKYLPVRNKYYMELIKILNGSNGEIEPARMFASDQVLLKGEYNYCILDFDNSNFDEVEMECLLRGCADAYYMIHYTTPGHIQESLTGGDYHALYDLVNRKMYTFIRSLIVNIIRSKTGDSLKKILFIMSHEIYKVLTEKLYRAPEPYIDGVHSLIAVMYYTKNMLKEITVDENNYVSGTSIYVGYPYQNLYEVAKQVTINENSD